MFSMLQKSKKGKKEIVRWLSIITATIIATGLVAFFMLSHSFFTKTLWYSCYFKPHFKSEETTMWKIALGHMSSNACSHCIEVRIRLVLTLNSCVTLRSNLPAWVLTRLLAQRRWDARAEIVWTLLLVEFHIQDAS